MSGVIVDTNVAVVANGQNTEVVARCTDDCIRFLIEAKSEHIVLIDAGDEILKEYAKALKMGLPYQLGAQFLIHIIQHQFDENRVQRVNLEKSQSGEFIDFPTSPTLEGFDLSDRKFAALACKMATPVTNAIDSDWVEHHEALKAHGIHVNFLCGCDSKLWFDKESN